MASPALWPTTRMFANILSASFHLKSYHHLSFNQLYLIKQIYSGRNGRCLWSLWICVYGVQIQGRVECSLCGSQSSESGVFIQSSLLYSLRQSLSLTWSSGVHLDWWLASKPQECTCLCFTSTETTGTDCCTESLQECQGPKLRSSHFHSNLPRPYSAIFNLSQ